MVLFTVALGDWRNWRKYQATILYLIVGDLLYNFLTYNYSMWRFEPTAVLPSHTASTLFIAFLCYPCSTILYLGHFPTGKMKAALWVVLWVGIWCVIEWIDRLLGLISYHHGWSFTSSILFSTVAVLMIRLHYTKPLWAYGLSALIVTALMFIYRVPIEK
ncbi:hypothetical protein LJK88_50150 [Paenibacillus sp. P26]|nr:hypothetical protein LJK88_50150 [Paenibacillus sp. P26]UUZ91416.1 hypothetical protein LJK87_38195 [Paenibacillus sp. P25]